MLVLVKGILFFYLCLLIFKLNILSNLCFRYNELLLFVDTCQAASLYGKLYSPNIISATSSLIGEDSLSVSQILYMLDKTQEILLTIL